MRIAVVCRGFYPSLGGGEKLLLHYVRTLVRDGHQVAVLTRLRGRVKKDEVLDGFQIRRRGGLKTVFALLALRWLGKNRDLIDVVFSFDLYHPAWVGAMANKLWGIPHSATATSNEVRYYLRNPRKARLIVEHTDLFFALSTEIANDFVKMGVQSAKIVHLPTHVDDRRYCPVSSEQKLELRKELGLPTDKVIVIYTGRFVRIKALDVMASAWDEMSSAVKERALLIMLGDGRWKQRLLEHTAGIPSIRLMPSTTEVHKYLQAADIYIQTSRYEGLSNSIQEAMASGLPVIATKVGGSPDQIENGSNGYLVEVDDQQSITSRLMELISNVDLRQSMGRASRDKILGMSPLRLSDRLQRLVNDLAKSAARGQE